MAVCKCGVPDIVDVDPSVRGEDLPLTRHLTGPLLHAELLSETVAAMGTGVRGAKIYLVSSCLKQCIFNTINLIIPDKTPKIIS